MMDAVREQSDAGLSEIEVQKLFELARKKDGFVDYDGEHYRFTVEVHGFESVAGSVLDDDKLKSAILITVNISVKGSTQGFCFAYTPVKNKIISHMGCDCSMARAFLQGCQVVQEEERFSGLEVLKLNKLLNDSSIKTICNGKNVVFDGHECLVMILKMDGWTRVSVRGESGIFSFCVKSDDLSLLIEVSGSDFNGIKRFLSEFEEVTN
ncbi:MAG: hypothetical protein WC269_04160 [Candidatus Gracilibacteria bacterium]|jgi:hypothetical protein